MGRLIAFDQQTASALVANTRTAAQLGHGSALKAALATESDATLLMPATSENELLVVSVRRPAARAVAPAAPVRERVAVNAPEPPRVVSEPAKRPQQHTVANPAANDMEPVAYEATGFLGLEDSPLYASDLEPKPKKKWWKKLLDND
jgi:hypothetical protein